MFNNLTVVIIDEFDQTEQLNNLHFIIEKC